eukprot:SAG22_NODE_630_length_8383_cov_5.839469_3_plen_107_part_00
MANHGSSPSGYALRSSSDTNLWRQRLRKERAGLQRFPMSLPPMTAGREPRGELSTLLGAPRQPMGEVTHASVEAVLQRRANRLSPPRRFRSKLPVPWGEHHEDLGE